MSSNELRAAIDDIQSSIDTVRSKIWDAQDTISVLSKSIRNLQEPLFHANDSLRTVSSRLELPLVALNPFNFSTATVMVKRTPPSSTTSSFSRVLLKGREVMDVNGEYAREFRNHVIIYGIEGAQGMSNFYVVCGGGDLLRDYREVEHNDECDAFIRHDSIRQRLLAAAQIPSGTINFASLSSIVHSMAIHPLSCTEITTVLWTIPNFVYSIDAIPCCVLRRAIESARSRDTSESPCEPSGDEA